MLAVAVSSFFALYVLGPDAFSRVVLGFTLPRRSVNLSRSEEVSRALIWAVASFSLAYLWASLDGSLAKTWNPGLFKVWFSGIDSEAYFSTHSEVWFGSLAAVLKLNRCLLLRTYAVVFLLSILLSILTHFYGVVRDSLPAWTWLREAFAAIVLPRVAPWHVLLSKLLLGDRSLSIHLDILTKADMLYQGAFADKTLAADGSLVSVTLANPRRFDREAYVQEKENGTKPSAELFWKKIPTNMFLVMASEIATVNLRYLPRDRSVRPLKAGSPDLTDLLKAIGEQVEEAKRQAVNGPAFTFVNNAHLSI